ncbi:MAG: prepilin peptidase, partial [Actinomycetales bacterium]
MLTVVLSVIAAALVGAAGPRVLAVLPEPEPVEESSGETSERPVVAPEDVKPLYADLARTPGLALWLALGAAVLAGISTYPLRDEPSFAPVWVLFSGVGTWLAYIDWNTRLLPFRLTVPLHAGVLLLVALAALLQRDWSVLVHGLVGNVVVFAIFWILWFIGSRFRGGALGYGDVRLGAVIGLALGPLGSTTTTVGGYAGFLLGAVGGVVLSALKIVNPRSFAFGPYLVVGAALGV